MKRRSVSGIWCCRREERYFLVSKVNGNAWYIIMLGREFWFGPGRPKFLNGGKRGEE